MIVAKRKYPMLELTNISKSFGAVKALSDVSLGLGPGEIRAFLGANGSGKSTMVKILSGLAQRDQGKICIDGESMSITTPQDARDHRIIAAYQDLSLLPRLSVEDNLALGHEKKNIFGLIDYKARWTQAEEMIDLFKIQARPDSLVENLDPSNQGLVELAKAYTWNPKYLLVDEITASLYKGQVDHVFSLLTEFAAKGMGILFVSHRLYEVFDLCSTATILRSGRSVADISLSDSTEDDLVFHMTGERQGRSFSVPNCPVQVDAQTVSDSMEPILQVEDFTVFPKVRSITMSVQPCEIIGIAGLQGQGQSEFLRALYGFIKPTHGKMRVSGKAVVLNSTSQAIRAGIGFLPGDREKEGVFPLRPISENLFAARDGVRAPLFLDSIQTCAREANEIIERLHVVTPGPFAPAKLLSGGNQQKIIVGRWLSMDLKILILDDPTKGVDIKSRREIHALLKEMAKSGVGMIYSSSDNEELLEICDKILVFFDGEIIQTLDRNEMSPDALASATLGVAGSRGAERQ